MEQQASMEAAGMGGTHREFFAQYCERTKLTLFASVDRSIHSVRCHVLYTAKKLLHSRPPENALQRASR
jgi:hypothetical protein